MRYEHATRVGTARAGQSLISHRGQSLFPSACVMVGVGSGMSCWLGVETRDGEITRQEGISGRGSAYAICARALVGTTRT